MYSTLEDFVFIARASDVISMYMLLEGSRVILTPRLVKKALLNRIHNVSNISPIVGRSQAKRKIKPNA